MGRGARRLHSAQCQGQCRAFGEANREHQRTQRRLVLDQRDDRVLRREIERHVFEDHHPEDRRGDRRRDHTLNLTLVRGRLQVRVRRRGMFRSRWDPWSASVLNRRPGSSACGPCFALCGRCFALCGHRADFFDLFDFFDLGHRNRLWAPILSARPTHVKKHSTAVPP